MQKTDNWTEVITPQGSLFDLKLKELWRYRDLIILFVRRDFVAIYKQTILGPLWHLVQPLMTTSVFTIIFSGIAQLPTDGQPAFLFNMCGVTIWGYFAGSLTKTSGTFLDNAGIFGKVYFPRLTVPVSVIISGMISFGIQFLLFLIIYAVFWINGASFSPNPTLFLIPFWVLLMAVLGLGLGIIISALTTKYRDLRFLVGFGTQLAMYGSAVFYPASLVPEKYQFYFLLNPVVPVIEGFRYAFFGTGMFSWTWIAYSAIISLVIFFFGVILFNRVERNFMDTI